MWKPIENYNSLYEVNEKGEVRSLYHWNGHKYEKRKKPYILKQSNTTTGYKKVELVKDGKRKSLKVHRLVAIAFIPNPMNKPYINHIDGNPINNCVENLEWCTQHENVVHAYKIGLRKISHITKEELQRYVENGVTFHQIMKKEHISVKRLQNYYKIYGVRNLSNKYNIDLNQLKIDLEKGIPNKELAKKYKCSNMLIATRKYQLKKGRI